MGLALNYRVLYVEDDLILQKETKRLLERMFKSVDVANDGQEALEAFAKERYDLVLSDIEMPLVDGLEMSKQIKSMEPSIPIIVISAYSNTEYLIDAISIGIDYYVLKPIQMPRFIDTLYQVCTHIHNSRVAKKYEEQKLQLQISEANENMMREIAKASPNAIVVYKDAKLFYASPTFERLFGKEEIAKLQESQNSFSDFLNAKIAIDQIFAECPSFIETINEEDLRSNEVIKLSLQCQEGKKIFQLFVSDLKLDSSSVSTMYTFNDITLLEFQRKQIDQYSEYMGDLTQSKYASQKSSDNPDIIDRTSF